MSQQSSRSSSSTGPSGGDPWHAFGYLVSGVATYGVIGWLLDRWLGTSFLVAVGILVGAVLGLYLTVKRFSAIVGPDDSHDRDDRPRSAQPTDRPEQD